MIYPKQLVFLLLLTALAFNKAFAGDTLYFAGNITVSKQVSYKYVLRFTIDSANNLTGYSLTDPKGPNETKTRIAGAFDSANKTISFEETKVLRSNVDLQKNNLCFVRATLQLKTTKLVETLSGKFTGFQPNSPKECADGEIRLINTARAKRILEETQNKTLITNIDSGNIKKINGDIIKVFTNNAKTLPITGSHITFVIWDNGQVDGDRITLALNDKYILQNYTLDSSIKVIEIDLPPGNTVDTIRIIALNEGTLPPNTAMIKILSATEQYPIEMQAQLNEVRTIYLKRQ